MFIFPISSLWAKWLVRVFRFCLVWSRMKGERNEKEVAWNLCRLEMSYLEEACNICTIHQYDLLDPIE